MDKQTRMPWTTNQISQEKPTVPRSTNMLVGYVAGSMNGGHNKVVAYKQVMAGERHKQYNLKMHIKMLTPLTPTYQNLKMTIRSYFVPNIRVWENAEKYTAQKGGTGIEKVKEIPNLGGKTIPVMENYEKQDSYTLISNTTWWRDSYISSYLPRIGKFIYGSQEVSENSTLPKISVLPLRGRIAIYNDMERNKEYDEEIEEFKNDTVSEQEWNSYLPNIENLDITTMRARKANSYYSDYRSELQGLNEEIPNTNDENTALLTWAAWEGKIAEARTEALNAEKNDWQIIAEMRGSKAALQGKVQLIGERTFNLNYAAITQNSYNNNTQIEDQFRVLGQQGAYSYTEINVPCYAGVEFIEEGYVHIIATVQAETVYESGFDRLELNVTPLDQYRPDLKDEKNDVLYNIETSTKYYAANNTSALGFKRKFSEYFKLPNCINSDMTTSNYYNVTEEGQFEYDYEIITQKTFQFFEEDSYIFTNPDGKEYYKLPWKDYTDLMINKNQAIQNYLRQPNNSDEILLDGQNQIFWVGKAECLADMPIDEAIKNNYTKWGEH